MENWTNFCWEEKIRQVRLIDETYMFSTSYSSVEDAVENLIIGYENDPEWFDFEVEDFGQFEHELKILLADYFDEREV